MDTPGRQDLEHRAGLPDALRVLLRDYPRDIWESHRNFDALTRFWLQRHMMFRDLLVKVQGETEAFLDGRSEARTYGGRSARLTGFLLNELHGHHQIEDVQYFPVLSGLERRLAPGFELLDGDHHALDGHLHALAEDTNATLQAIASGDGAAARDAAGPLHRRLERFAGFLDRHLIDEEELVIPVILHHAPRF
ncbi:MAG: hemerythrin domain-containing protein [Alkalilacustris sp.]